MTDLCKVHLMGGDSTGWALDQDLATTHFALSSVPDLIQLTSLEDADVVHAVWEEPLLALDPKVLEKKRIVCHVCNDIFKTFENSFMLNARYIIGSWIAISKCGLHDLKSFGLNAKYIPYTLNVSHFHPTISSKRLESLRSQHKIPKDSYVIGNFMRDTLGADLTVPKPQKGAEVFLRIIQGLYDRGLPVHVLLAGPRRHWLIRHFRERHVSFSYAGKITDEDDNGINLLSQDQIGELYHLIDINLVTSRWEGGPRCVLEAAATNTKIVCPSVGMAPDILEPECIYNDIDVAVSILQEDIESDFLGFTTAPQYERLISGFVPSANISRFRELYSNIEAVEPFDTKQLPSCYTPPPELPQRIVRYAKRKAKSLFLSKKHSPYIVRIGLWHQYFKPPYGGGNQFMMALQRAIKSLGVKVAVNNISSSIDVHICNSAWFDVKKFQSVSGKKRPRIIHRVDGPIALYRESTWDEDNRIYNLNNEWASSTVYQSAWCYRKMLELDFKPVRPLIIHNAVNEKIFHRNNRIKFDKNRKIRLISTAWSDNPRKGGPFFKALEKKLDWGRFSYTFVGNVQQEFDKIEHLPPQNSEKLADTLRQHDIYVMASESEACSNALLEALACGLPVLYLKDGGNGELVGFGGLSFLTQDEALDNLDRIVAEYDMFQDGIYVASIEDIAKRYLDLAEQLMT